MQNKRLKGILLTILVLFAIPLIAMQFTDQVKWSFADFIVAAILLSGTGLMIELVLRKVSKTSHRIAICAMVLIVLCLTWLELAVGIFGLPLAGS